MCSFDNEEGGKITRSDEIIMPDREIVKSVEKDLITFIHFNNYRYIDIESC